jgi:hypothetical protein
LREKFLFCFLRVVGFLLLYGVDEQEKWLEQNKKIFVWCRFFVRKKNG